MQNRKNVEILQKDRKILLTKSQKGARMVYVNAYIHQKNQMKGILRWNY